MASGSERRRMKRDGNPYSASEWIEVSIPDEVPEQHRKFAGPKQYIAAKWSDDFSCISDVLRLIMSNNHEGIVGFDVRSCTGRDGRKRPAAITVCGRSACIIVRAHEMSLMPDDLKKLIASDEVLKVCTVTDDMLQDDLGAIRGCSICSTQALFEQERGDDEQLSLGDWSKEWLGIDVCKPRIDAGYCWTTASIDESVVRNLAIKTWCDMMSAIHLFACTEDSESGDATSWAGNIGGWGMQRSEPRSVHTTDRGHRRRGRRGGERQRRREQRQCADYQSPLTVECNCRKEFACSVCNVTVGADAVEAHFADIRHCQAFYKSVVSSAN